MKLMNPFLLIKEELSEATTASEKLLVLFIAGWAGMLSALVVSGVLTIIYNVITNPSIFNNATFGVFDSLG